jgi:hypothetical protein
MLLTPKDAEFFFRLQRTFLHYISQRLQLLPETSGADDFERLPAEEIAKVRDAFITRPELLDSFIAENPAELDAPGLAIVDSWRHFVKGDFFLFRQLKRHMVFLSMDEPAAAYGVTALTDPFAQLIGPRLPVMVQAVLLPFKNRIVYDGLLARYNIAFGGNIKRRLNDSYREAKARQGVITTLPPARQAPDKPKTVGKGAKKSSSNNQAEKKRAALEAVTALTESFCRERLNNEYADLCRKLAEKLARKRPSPLLKGRTNVWAAGIVRAVGRVNFLDDRTTQPYLGMHDIDAAFGVASSTGQSKAKTVRDAAGMRVFDPEWTLPSQMDRNPTVWMLEVNGMIVDVRHAPRELQAEAFRRGLIPYIPADRKQTRPEAPPRSRDVQQKTDTVYEIKITLLGIDPPIWRRIRIEECTLDQLHRHIQCAMGWTNSHLHQFVVDRRIYGDPDLLGDGAMEAEILDSTQTPVSRIKSGKSCPVKFLYEYDFGDGWEHEVRIERSLKREPGKRCPACLDGARNCPPEDVGGVWGYMDYLHALGDPTHEEHESRLEWNGPFDPEQFDAGAVTRQLRRGLGLEEEW